MSLEPGMRDLLSAARRGLEPTDEARDRTRAALSRKLGAGVFLAATTTAGTAGGAVAAATLGKVALLGALFVGGALGVRSLVGAPAATRPAPPASVTPSVTSAAAATKPSSVTAAPSPSAPVLAPVPASVPPSTNQKPVAPAASSDDLDGELALLRRARLALAGGQLDAALALLDEHAATYPHGTFTEERRGLGLVAQCKAGRGGAAARARAFLVERPGSPMAARIVEACGLDKETP